MPTENISLEDKLKEQCESTKDFESLVYYYIKNKNSQEAFKIALEKIGVGRAILVLLETKQINKAVKLAYEEFGINRAVAIYLNHGLGPKAAQFAEKHSHLRYALDMYINLGLRKDSTRLAAQFGVTLENGSKHKKPVKFREYDSEEQNLYIESP